MGFFSSLTGWDKSMAALNAVMGSYVMENSDLNTKIAITDEIAKIISSVRYGKVDKEFILSELSKESRVVQMNFVALACDNLHIEPPFKNSYWERIKNPYAIDSQVYDITIEGAIKALRKEANGDVAWPGISASFDFTSLYGESSHKKYGDLDAMAIETAIRFILCINSYLSDNTQLPYLGPADMDAVTEMALNSFGIKTDQILFSKYCFAVQDVATKRTLDDSLNNHTLGKQLRLELDFDNSFPSYCRDLGLNHLLKPTINTDVFYSSDPVYRNYISKEDELAFGKDLIDLIDKVFDHTHSMLSNEKRPKDSIEISQEDFDAFGVDLAGCIAFYTAHALINLRSHDKTLPDVMLKTASETLGDSFGPDLLDLITRYCAYKSASLE